METALSAPRRALGDPPPLLTLAGRPVGHRGERDALSTALVLSMVGRRLRLRRHFVRFLSYCVEGGFSHGWVLKAGVVPFATQQESGFPWGHRGEAALGVCPLDAISRGADQNWTCRACGGYDTQRGRTRAGWRTRRLGHIFATPVAWFAPRQSS